MDSGQQARVQPGRDGALPEFDPTLRDRVLRLVGVLDHAARARTRPTRHTGAHPGLLALVDVTDQLAITRPGAAGEEILRVSREVPHQTETFDALCALHRLVADAPEAVELALAGGLLHHPDLGIHVHLLSRPVAIEHEAGTGQMVVTLAGRAVALADDEVLGASGLVDPAAAAAAGRDVVAALTSPLDHGLSDVLRAWAARCLRVPHAVGDDWIAPSGPATRLVPAPALIARRREPRTARALRSCYEHVAAELADPARPLPVGLAQLVAAIEPADRAAWLARAGHDVEPLTDPLFPLPVGAAQARILRRLGRDSGVVVEGPPGTGKTHTIANLVSALLAEGRRVLVTSEKAQALRVLRDQLPAPMRALCVADARVSDAVDPDSDLAAGIEGLAARSTQHDPDAADREIAELTEHRRALLAARDAGLDAVAAACNAEDADLGVVAPGFAGSRVEVARRVAATRERDGWLAAWTGDAELPGDPPLSTAEMRELWALLADGTATRHDAGRPSPVSGLLSEATAARLPVACLRVADAVRALDEGDGDREWARGVVDAVLDGRGAARWTRAVSALERVDELIEHDRAAGSAQVRVTGTIEPAAAAAALERLAEHLGAGGSTTRWFRSDAQKAVDDQLRGAGVTVDGADLRTAAGATAVAHHLRILEITDHLGEASRPLGRAVRRAEHRSDLVEQALGLRAACLRVGAVLSAVAGLRALLAGVPGEHRPRLDGLGAVENAVAELGDQGRVEHLGAILERSVPGLVERIGARDATADVSARLERWPQAWAHARAAARLVPRGIDLQLEDSDAELADVTARLAVARAWRACLARITAEQMRALQSHRGAEGALGRGTGRWAERYRQVAREAVAVARDAVPAWVMPIREVLATVEPIRDAFDVVIVDEASQADLTSLFLLWLAPRVIVVGDDRQCSPAEVGIGALEPAFARLDTELADVPFWLRSQFTPRASVFSVFRATFGPPIRLREHFRSMPEIIGWSSETFYASDTAGDGEPLIPLRPVVADRLPPLRATFVPGAEVAGAGTALANRAEAGALVDAVARAAKDPAYDDATFGVVVLQGHGQIELVERLLRERLDVETFTARRLRVGSAADFQGDERSVVWLSMVVAPGHRPAALTAERYRQSVNVAASRARDQLWLFHSVGVDDLAGADLRRALLQHVTASESVGPLGVPRSAVDRGGSRFTRQVAADLTARGFAVEPGVRVHSRSLDLVVTGAAGRVAVTCDGEGRRRPADRAEVAAEEDLRRCGWSLHRIVESAYVLDPSTALGPVLDALAGPPGPVAPTPVSVVEAAPGDGGEYVPTGLGAPADTVDALVEHLLEAGFAPPRRAAEVRDPRDGSLLVLAAALWPTGISRRAIASPVVLAPDADPYAVSRLGGLGYEVFTEPGEVRERAAAES